MDIPKGYKIAFQINLPQSEVDFITALKETVESASERIEELEHRRDEAMAIIRGSVLRRYWEMDREHIRGAQILFDEDRKAIIEVVADESEQVDPGRPHK